jgi:hypothetical protein
MAEHRMITLSDDGDTLLATWDPADTASVQVAETAFRELVRKHVIYNDVAGGPGIGLKEFDAEAEQIVVTKPTAGG